nr:MFS transporter [Rhizobium laguerreae]
MFGLAAVSILAILPLVARDRLAGAPSSTAFCSRALGLAPASLD